MGRGEVSLAQGLLRIPRMRWVKRSTGRARQLRRDQTSAEQTLWRHLRRSEFESHKFRRQHPIGPYFADFACVACHLVVELDGAGHESRAANDAVRVLRLRDLGWKVLRFGNHDVVLNLGGVLERIAEELRNFPSP